MTLMHLLVLERDPEQREALLGLLRAGGHHAVAAPDAAAAAAAIGLPGFDALLLDLGLPDLDTTRLREALVPAEAAAPDSLEAAERRHIALALRHTGGNKRQAALLLGISRSTLLHKVRKYGLAAARLGLIAMLTLGWSGLAAGQAGPPAIPLPPGRVSAGTLSFDGHGTPGDFVGRTSTVTGEMTGGNGLAAVRGWVQAPVRSLVTGNDRRDRDLVKSMEPDKYPTLRFELRGVKAGSGTADSVPVMLQGVLAIHGVSRDVSLPGYVRREGDHLRVRTDFPLNLKDYRIGGLSKALGLLKMDEHIEVHVDLSFAPTP
ncbi:MAG TPA: YceI family protein [Gemmatimonadales bacterium]|nr:YceI family protein [Gemmatimonadales bacterium]